MIDTNRMGEAIRIVTELMMAAHNIPGETVKFGPDERIRACTQNPNKNSSLAKAVQTGTVKPQNCGWVWKWDSENRKMIWIAKWQLDWADEGETDLNGNHIVFVGDYAIYNGDDPVTTLPCEVEAKALQLF